MTRERRIYAERQKPSLTPAQADVERLRFGTWRAEMMSSSSICCFEPLGFIWRIFGGWGVWERHLLPTPGPGHGYTAPRPVSTTVPMKSSSSLLGNLCIGHVADFLAAFKGPQSLAQCHCWLESLHRSLVETVTIALRILPQPNGGQLGNWTPNTRPPGLEITSKYFPPLSANLNHDTGLFSHGLLKRGCRTDPLLSLRGATPYIALTLVHTLSVTRRREHDSAASNMSPPLLEAGGLRISRPFWENGRKTWRQL